MEAVFSTDDVGGVRNFNACYVCGLIRLSSWPFFMGLSLWSVLGFFYSYFSVNTRGLVLFSGEYLKLSISMVCD
jgi:hypothetical protein